MIYLEANSVKELYEKLGEYDNVHSIQIIKEDSKFSCIAQDEPVRIIIEHPWAVKLDDEIPVWVMGGSDNPPIPVRMQ